MYHGRSFMAFMALGDIRNLLNLRSWSWSRAIPWQIRGRATILQCTWSFSHSARCPKKPEKVSPMRRLWNVNLKIHPQHWLFQKRKDDYITLQQHFNIVWFQARWQIVRRTNWGKRWLVLLNRFGVSSFLNFLSFTLVYHSRQDWCTFGSVAVWDLSRVWSIQVSLTTT